MGYLCIISGSMQPAKESGNKQWLQEFYLNVLNKKNYQIGKSMLHYLILRMQDAVEVPLNTEKKHMQQFSRIRKHFLRTNSISRRLKN